MGREVRKVPAGWQHPKDGSGKFVALFDGGSLSRRTEEWDRGAQKWAEGLRDDFNGGWVPLNEDQSGMSYDEWDGARPDPSDYMPAWPDGEATHLMMYEDTSEGTPISPAFSTPEELARWLADNNASAFAGMGADYDHWLTVCRGRPSVGMVIAGGVMMSGVQAMK